MQTRTLFLALLPFLAWAGSNQTPAVSLERLPQGGIQPQLAVENNGQLHMIYFSGDPKAGDLSYVRSTAAGEPLTRPLRVNSQQGSAIALGTIRDGQIAVGSSGRVHVAWNGSNTALPRGPVNPEAGKPGAPMLYTRLNDQATAFEPQRNLMLRTFGLDGGGTVAADKAGNVYVGWHAKAVGAAEGEAGRQVWIAESHDSGKTFAAEKPAWSKPTGACGCCSMALFVDNDGDVLGLYRSATNNVHRDIYLIESKDHGDTFTGSLVHRWEVNACPMSSMSFAANGGTTFGAWETGGQVFFGKIEGAKIPKSSPPQERVKAGSIPGSRLIPVMKPSSSGRKALVGRAPVPLPGKSSIAMARPSARKGQRRAFRLGALQLWPAIQTVAFEFSIDRRSIGL